MPHSAKILSMPRFGLEKAPMRLRQLHRTEGDGPGRCERGDRGHDRDRAFREKGAALYPICRHCGIKTLLTMSPLRALRFSACRVCRLPTSLLGIADLPQLNRHPSGTRVFPARFPRPSAAKSPPSRAVRPCAGASRSAPSGCILRRCCGTGPCFPSAAPVFARESLTPW